MANKCLLKCFWSAGNCCWEWPGKKLSEVIFGPHGKRSYNLSTTPASAAGMRRVSTRARYFPFLCLTLFPLFVFSRLSVTWFIANFMWHIEFRPSCHLTLSVPGLRNYVELNHSLHLILYSSLPILIKRSGQVTGWKEAKRRTPKRWRLPRVFDSFTLNFWRLN